MARVNLTEFALPKHRSVSRKYNLAGDSVGRETFVHDVTGFSLQAIQDAIINITAEITQAQIKMNNQPNLILVDGATNKPLNQVKRRVVVSFGTRITLAVMKTVEEILHHAIQLSTQTKTGKLADIPANWEWVYVPGFSSDKTKRGGVISHPDQIKSFNFADRLILRPTSRIRNSRGGMYATAANKRVASGGSSLSIKTRGRRGRKGASDFQSKRLQSMGFLAYTANRIRRTANFKSLFSVYVTFSKRFQVSGEVSKKQGTGALVIRPKRVDRFR